MSNLEFFALDAPVGSGKTEAAIRHILGQQPGSDIYWGEDDPVGGMNFTDLVLCSDCGWCSAYYFANRRKH
jgi:hypothetical protein